MRTCCTLRKLHPPYPPSIHLGGGRPGIWTFVWRPLSKNLHAGRSGSACMRPVCMFRFFRFSFVFVLATAAIRTSAWSAMIPPECLQSLLHNLTDGSPSFCVTGSAAVATTSVNNFASCSKLSTAGLRVGALQSCHAIQHNKLR